MTAFAEAEAFPAPRRFMGVLTATGGRIFLILCIIAVLLIFAFPIFWLILTSLRPAWAVFYVHRGTEFTLDNYFAVWDRPQIAEAYLNSLILSTVATVLSLAVTVTSGYMLSRFTGRIPTTWFAAIYVFRTVPYITWVLPLYFFTQWAGIFDTYLGILLPHVAVHICFFSWIMKGFFDGIDPSMESAALIDGCTRWGAFWRVALPSAIPGIAALSILCWLWTWNEFLFALILTGQKTPILTAIMAQFVTDAGTQWNLMTATAVTALLPALVVALFGQKYVVSGLRI
jgi:multiple sugar transport system permease protein